jgi:2,3-bisphosphoglycerate-dependent phosphoglycerate mutase
MQKRGNMATNLSSVLGFRDICEEGRVNILQEFSRFFPFFDINSANCYEQRNFTQKQQKTPPTPTRGTHLNPNNPIPTQQLKSPPRATDIKIRIFVFRHAETTDNQNHIFSGWRDPDLTEKGIRQAQQIAEQLANQKINYAFTSHLKRAWRTLDIALKPHGSVPVFVDDRLIERCYGELQGKNKLEVAAEKPDWYAQVHRGYDFPPPNGESLKMVESRVLPFINELKTWLRQHPGNVAISCHGNSMRPIRRVFENLSLEEMLKLENPQDHAMEYTVEVPAKAQEFRLHPDWCGSLVPSSVELASDPQNPMHKYY